ncbi:exopolysaccharide Pel transporter PelG [Chitinimonas viridis]|uniref:Exopolysaccharide Pel transporter PelG n=2 Tax=Chitinimonas TaxID=240411 RepID=A0ABT8B5R6_9NEIS|nr:MULTISPECIES: exopolysaccharide Pel transporter PelG [Chitinimonas]MDN3576898.1 exopolysaccharide Pel transporter PelG [Chitinimonas viridis]GLR13779.1 pellicle/biofilm biosynthesis Wzx-like polysaccharide transporter PelG [Chitinimonas prasina]
MAGIGFELRKLLNKKGYLGLLQGYFYAGLISSGPWVLSILGVLLIGFFSIAVVVPDFLIAQFQVTVTYIMAVSLILTGFIQLGFTRFIADRLFEHKDYIVLANFNGVLLAVTLAAGLLGGLSALFLFPEESVLYRLLLAGSFVVMSDIWIAAIFLSGMKRYKAIVLLFFLGYSITVAAALLMRPFGLEGLMGGFFIGQSVLLWGMVALVLYEFPGADFVRFDWLEVRKVYPSLIWTGFFYNLAAWADKFIFWYYPYTSNQVIGPLRASEIYDFPIFLAYLSIIPGMAVFLVRMETDFVEYYEKFYNAVREGETLQYIEEMRNEMVATIRQGIAEIVKIQGIAILLVFALGPILLDALHISRLHLPLLYVDVVSAGLQVVFLGLLNVFFYLDRRRIVLMLTGLLVVSNVLFTSISLYLGAAFYGYGFAAAMLLTVTVAMLVLDRKLETLEYETFMLQ